MDKDKIIEMLREDEHYYGAFGKNYRSNSDISRLFDNPLSLSQDQGPNINFLIGGYFHTAVLEPEKLSKYRVLDHKSRVVKGYKQEADGEMCMLTKDVENINKMIGALMSNDACRELVRGVGTTPNLEYELPGITELAGLMWKGKADIVNHDLNLIIDLKTTSNINNFKSSSFKYNYDSQAYIYSKLFGYDFMFIAIDKKTHQVGIFDCSPDFLARGAEKVERASEIYRLFYEDESFDPTQYFINKTL